MTSPDAPAVAVFDVNETLSDLSGLVPRFQAAGVDPGLLPVWFAATLRDAFALTAAGGYAEFSDIAVATLATLLSSAGGLRGSPQTVAKEIVQAMAELDLHADVAEGLRAFSQAGVRIVTLSNGASSVAESLLARAGLRDLVEQCLSVSDVGRFKPAAEAYAHAAERCQVPSRRTRAHRRPPLGHRRGAAGRLAGRLALPRRRAVPAVPARARGHRLEPGRAGCAAHRRALSLARSS